MIMNIKKDIALVALGFLVAFLAFSIPGKAEAQLSEKQITANYNGISIIIDGETLHPKDANGNIVLPFVSDGTTYLPLRAVAEAVGYDVFYNASTVSAVLTKKVETPATTPTPEPSPETINTTLQSNLINRLNTCISKANSIYNTNQTAYNGYLSRGMARSSAAAEYAKAANQAQSDISSMKSLKTNISNATTNDQLKSYQSEVVAYEAIY